MAKEAWEIQAELERFATARAVVASDFRVGTNIPEVGCGGANWIVGPSYATREEAMKVAQAEADKLNVDIQNCVKSITANRGWKKAKA